MISHSTSSVPSDDIYDHDQASEELQTASDNKVRILFALLSVDDYDDEDSADDRNEPVP